MYLSISLYSNGIFMNVTKCVVDCRWIRPKTNMYTTHQLTIHEYWMCVFVFIWMKYFFKKSKRSFRLWNLPININEFNFGNKNANVRIKSQTMQKHDCDRKHLFNHLIIVRIIFILDISWFAIFAILTLSLICWFESFGILYRNMKLHINDDDKMIDETSFGSNKCA